MDPIRRRWMLALALVANPALAQRTAATRRIAVVTGASESFFGGQRASFESALAVRGWRVDENLSILYRYIVENDARVQATISELRAARTEVLVTMGGFEDRDLPVAAQSFPVIALFGGDPVAQRLVSSFARPGGNLTGLSSFGGPELPKLLETALSAFPGLRRLGVLHPGIDAAEERRLSALSAALRVDVTFAEASSEADVAAALASLKQRQASAVLVMLDRRWSIPRVGDALIRARLPSIADVEAFAEGGGLVAYGPGVNLASVMERFAHFVDRILRGSKARDLPVESFPNARLVVNLRTARAIGHEFPSALLIRADRVIE